MYAPCPAVADDKQAAIFINFSAMARSILCLLWNIAGNKSVLGVSETSEISQVATFRLPASAERNKRRPTESFLIELSSISESGLTTISVPADAPIV